MKNVKKLFVGLVFLVIGIFMFLQNLTFNDPSNQGMLGGLLNSFLGEASPKAISGALFVVVLLTVLLFAFMPNGYTLTGLMVSIIVTVLIVIGSLDVTIADMSGLEVGIVAGLIMVGVGLAGNAIISLTLDNKSKSLN